MKRVLQVMGGLNRGGLETFAMNIYRAIDKEETYGYIFQVVVHHRSNLLVKN